MSSYLITCGIPMGDEMLSAGIGNVHGHFEDKEILEYHKSLLKENVVNTYLPKKTVKYGASDIKQAKNIIDNRNKSFQIWGWKDPRSTLFLDLWSECSSDIKFVFMYRAPYEVVSSLCRRIKKFKSPLVIIMPWLGCHSWIQYNKKIIDFYKANPDISIVVSINGFINSPDITSDVLKEWLEVTTESSFSEIFHPEDMKTGGDKHKVTLYERYQKFVYSLYSKKMNKIHAILNDVAAIPSEMKK